MKITFYIIFSMLFLSGCMSSILDDPSTTIIFSIPERSYIKLTVENSYNTVIAVLADGEMIAGSHKVNFNSENLAEGIYFYILEARGIDDSTYYKSIKHMLLIK